MGKREVLIVVAFIAIGVIAYQFTAKPARPGQGFSLSRLITNARRQAQENAANGVTVVRGTIAIGPAKSEIGISGIAQTIQVIGESRADVEYEMTVESNGPDEATAKDWAGRSTIKADDLGMTLAIKPVFPPEGRQTARLKVHVPSRLRVRIDASHGIRVSNVAGLRIDGLIGDANVESIAGPVSGSQHNGNFTITGAAGGTLSLVSSNATFERISDRLTLTTRSSHCRITDSSAAIDLDETNTDVSITNPTGMIHVSGTGGGVTIANPTAETNVEVRRAEVELTVKT